MIVKSHDPLGIVGAYFTYLGWTFSQPTSIEVIINLLSVQFPNEQRETNPFDVP